MLHYFVGVSKFHADVMFRDKKISRKRQDIMKLLFVIASKQTVVVINRE